MSKTFFDIALDRERAQRLCNETYVRNMKLQRESGDCTQFVDIHPGKIMYVDKMASSLGDTRSALNKFNMKCIDKYKDAAEKINPVGLEVPKVSVTSDDDEIKDYYKNMRTVLHDKFQEASKLNEGGEGWVKFIDTLATPAERVANYNIPQFNDISTQFLKEKEVTKVSKPDLIKAIKTICDYDRQMGQIIADADDYCEEIAKYCWVYECKASPFSFEESTACLAEFMLLMETDMLYAQELEVRSKALLENLKNAHRSLSGLCLYNPRSIKETSPVSSNFISVIESSINEIYDNPKEYIDRDKKSIQETTIEKINQKYKKKIIDDNKRFIDTYADAALKSSCAGLSMKTWLIPIDIVSPIKQSIAIVLSVLDYKKLASHDITHLASLYESAKAMEKAINSDSTAKVKDKITSPAMKKAVSILPWVDNDGDSRWAFIVKKNYSIKKADIKDAVNFLKDIESDFKILDKEAVQDSKNMSAMKKEVDGLARTKISEKEKFINSMRRIAYRIICVLNAKKMTSGFYQLKYIQTQSRKAITMAARVVKESTLVEEKNYVTEIVKAYGTIEKSFNSIITELNLPKVEE